MLDNIELIMDNYAKEGILFYHDLISCFNGSSFSRIRKLSTLDILFQMINRHGRTQWAEVQELCEHKDMTITDKGFFMARSKFNPEAVHVMADEFIANMYDNYNDSMQKWKDLLVLSVDGSKITVPDTAENKEVFGTQTSSVTENQPAMALTSTLHDSINHLKLDLQVDRITQSERTLALKHIDHYCETIQTGLCLSLTEDMYPCISLTLWLKKNSIFCSGQDQVTIQNISVRLRPECQRHLMCRWTEVRQTTTGRIVIFEIIF